MSTFPPSDSHQFVGHLDARRMRRQRAGAIYFAELILVMPILTILFLAVVQFGMFFTNLQMVNFAAREGALSASNSGAPGVGAVAANVEAAVAEHLAASGITQCSIVVEHNGGTAQTINCPCTPSNFTTPPGNYVRVTVCVAQSELMPNLLQPFGYSITGANDVVNCSATFQQEL